MLPSLPAAGRASHPPGVPAWARTETRHEVGEVIEVCFDPARPTRSGTGLSSLREWHLLGLPGAGLLLVLGLVALADGLALVDLGWDVSSS